MRRISSTRPTSHIGNGQEEQGAVAVIVAFLLVALLGFAALAIDVGAIYAEKAQLQNGADASALAIASDCAQGSCGDIFATGGAYANNNANDGSSGIQSITFPKATTVRVETNARDAGTGADSFSLYFARILGNDETVIDASAEASWGAPSSGTSFPWTFSHCVFQSLLSSSQRAELSATGTFTGDPLSTRVLLRYDEGTPAYPGCAAQNGYAAGGFGWLDLDGSGCSASVDIAVGEAGGNPGNNFPGICEAMLPTIKNEPILIPLFSTSSGSGSHATYPLVGFAAFQVTGWKFSGNSSLTSLDPAAPSCTGNCRGIQGYFTRYVSLAEGMSVSGGVPDFGVTVVSLSG